MAQDTNSKRCIKTRRYEKKPFSTWNRAQRQRRRRRDGWEQKSRGVGDMRRDS